MLKKISLTTWIFIALFAGAAVGEIYRWNHDDLEARKHFASQISILSDIFLRLIKMIIAPLVFSTLVVGIAKLGDFKVVGRIGGKTLAWFIGASLISLLFGLVIMNISGLGHDLHL